MLPCLTQNIHVASPSGHTYVNSHWPQDGHWPVGWVLCRQPLSGMSFVAGPLVMQPQLCEACLTCRPQVLNHMRRFVIFTGDLHFELS